MLRMGTNDESITQAKWIRGLDSNHDNQYQVVGNKEKNTAAMSFCVEASPFRYKQLVNAAKSTGYGQRGLTLLNYALDANDLAHTWRSNVLLNKTESDSCRMKSATCDRVDALQLDELAKEQGLLRDNKRIDMLRINDGDHRDVLAGGRQTLRRTAYLQLSHHWQGKKQKGSLLKAIQQLDRMDFTCYWPGVDQLWKITGCWLKHYNGLFWAHITCVNRAVAPDMAQQMEHLFNATARLRPDGIPYGTVSSLREVSLLATDSVSHIPSCSISQHVAIKRSLPNIDICASDVDPWLNKCPFSKLTGCSESSWLERYYQEAFSGEEFIAINVGCNKGFDAVNFLRMGSNDASIGRSQWKEAMPAAMKPAVCSQHKEELQYQVVGGASIRKALVYCLEPMPATYKALKKAAVTSGYEAQGLQVRQFAVNNYDAGDAYFPNATTQAGAEKTGLGSECIEESAECELVKTTRLDLLMEEEGLTDKQIDVLLIDVEGWDFEVLKGGSDTLRRTSYLEFEFNWRGKWGADKGNRPLFKAITILDNLEFTCYWAGKGDLRRITGCWQEQYRGIFWSNVACVNRVLAPDFATRLESLFNSTINATSST